MSRRVWVGVGVVLGATLQIGLTVAALRDISGRTAGELRGSRRRWVLLSFVNFVGPLAYFVRGRRPGHRPPERTTR